MNDQSSFSRTASEQKSGPQAQTIDSPTDIPPRGWKQVLLDSWKEAGEDNLELVSAGVAFYAFLAFVPLLSAFVLSYGLVAEPASVVRHMQVLTEAMPASAADIVGDQLQNMVEGSGTRTGFALLLAIAIALYGGSRGATAIMASLNVAYDVEESRGFVKRTAMALGMTAGAVLVLFLAVLAISALNFIGDLLPELGGAMHLLLKIGFFVLAAGGVMLLLAVIYRYGPNRPEAKWQWVSPGSAIATIVWLLATLGFGFYVSNFGSYNATYGSLGAVIVFLTWLYLTAYIILLGAELNSVLELRAGAGTVRADAAPEGGPPRAANARGTEAPGASASSATAAPTAPSAASVLSRWFVFSMLLGLLGSRRAKRNSG